MSKKNTLESKNEGQRGIKSKKSGGINIRAIRDEDVSAAGELMSRLKKLNGEFDPLLKTSDGVDQESTKAIKQAMMGSSSIVLVAVAKGKVAGVVKADIIDRIFYEPRKAGAIVEFYILPEFRRGNLGKDLLSAISEQLKKKGAELITAEFPSQNEIAKRFYLKLGFRSLTNVFAKAE
ncbi:MAG: GNAT family N-acetyltransferase [Nitrososphaerales archaeon]